MDTNAGNPTNKGAAAPGSQEALTPQLKTTEAELRAQIARLERDLEDRDIEMQAIIDEYELMKVELQTAKEVAERANQVKSAFLASMSHELRTPLNAVINFSKFVLRGVMGPVNERQAETLTKVVDSAQHLLNLINDVLDMSKIESGSLTLFVEEDIDVNEIVKVAISSAEGLLTDKPVKLDIDVDENLPRMLGDRKRVLQIMLNILSNACKFTEEGTIHLKVRGDAETITVSVQDSGPGIAEEDREDVFQSFKQTSAGLRQGGGGTGLGMPISKNLAEAHGGKLWFESTVGEGSTFYVTLPVRSAKLKPAEQ